MGLGGIKTAWQRQTKDFAHTKGDKYTSLVFDNRGMGESDKPLSRYSTSEMAKDTIELLDHVGWTGQRQLHIIGISMGGMIAQEMVRHMSLTSLFQFLDKRTINSFVFPVALLAKPETIARQGRWRLCSILFLGIFF